MTNVKKNERPAARQSRANRPNRGSVSGFRDLLTVEGKDPDYEYRWVRDTDENGQRIMRLSDIGYEFVRSDSGVKIGQNAVYTSENVGSIIRRPAGMGEYLYLMRIHKEFYNEDKAEAQKLVDEIEQGMVRNTGKEPGQDNLYGSVSVTTTDNF